MKPSPTLSSRSRGGAVAAPGLAATLSALTLLAGLIGGPEEVRASPWLLKPGQIVLTGQYSYAAGNEEFLAKGGDALIFSLNGTQAASSYTVAARFGISKGFEMEISLPYKHVSYDADPVILLPREATLNPLDVYQENIIDLSRTVSGIGDLELTARFQALRGPVVVSTALRLTAPTGYAPPEGTFGAEPRYATELVADPGRYINPKGISDDVTLGHGQLSLTPQVLLGYATRGGTFLRAETGLVFRPYGGGEELLARFKFGHLFKRWLLVYAGVGLDLAVTDGEIIGVSVAAVDPTLPAKDYGGLTNLDLIEVTLDYDRIEIPVGVIFRLSKVVEFNVSHSRVVWGRNVAKTQTTSFCVAFRTRFEQ